MLEAADFGSSPIEQLRWKHDRLRLATRLAPDDLGLLTWIAR